MIVAHPVHPDFKKRSLWKDKNKKRKLTQVQQWKISYNDGDQ